MKGLVSLDGSSDTVAMQLRLLPPSPKILILPPLSAVVQVSGGDGPFDARAFIRHVHEVFSARLELARSFLQYSSCTQPRLVFMNGGSISALTTCIATICEKVTGGNIPDAEELFSAIAKGGVAGLSYGGATVYGNERKSVPIDAVRKDGMVPKSSKAISSSNTSHLDHNGPSAIDTADFIDRLIDSLQKPLPDLPVQGQSLNIISSAEHSRTTNTPVPPDVPRLKSRFWTDERVIPKAEQTNKYPSRGRRLSVEGRQGNLDYLPSLRYTSRDSSTYTDAVMYQGSKESDSDDAPIRLERPASAPSGHALGRGNDYSRSYIEGKLTRNVEKSKSVDCFQPGDIQSSSLDIGPRKLKLGKFSPFTFSPFLLSENASIEASKSSDSSECSGSPEPLHHTTNDGAQNTPNEDIFSKNTLIDNSPSIPADIDARIGAFNSSEVASEPSIHSSNVKEPAPFEPIFAILEDLIIHFKSEETNELLETVIQGYRRGIYPIRENNVSQIPITPTSPTSIFSSNGAGLSGASQISAESDEVLPRETTEVGLGKSHLRSSKELSDISSEISSETSSENISDSPSVYASDEDSIAPRNGLSARKPHLSEQGNNGNTIHSILKPRLQIPITNPEAPPPEEVTGNVAKIEDLGDTGTANAIALQDSIRRLLSVHYPPETTHYKQHIFALENDRFWEPVFGLDAKSGNEERTVEQIVALGYEDGVEKSLHKDVVEKLDKLGTSTTGVRSSKLDIRFLVIYAMQTFTSQPLCLQAGENPFSQPSLLATLLVPHLETFLSSSCPTRLLILHYPVSHLSTVLALRDLLGSQFLKIAGIIDSTAISPPKPSRDRPDSIASVDEWVSIATSQSASPTQEHRILRTLRVSPPNSMPQPSFSKADFLLLSPATEDEISTFLASIWKSLTFPSASFFIPDDILSPSGTLHGVGSFSGTSSHNAPPTPPPDRPIAVTRTQKHLSPTRAPKRVSFVDSTTSTDISAENARRREKQSEKDWEKLESERRERLSEKAWESFMMANENDDSLLELERIFMPHLHFMPRATRRIGDPRKALKWLGLD